MVNWFVLTSIKMTNKHLDKVNVNCEQSSKYWHCNALETTYQTLISSVNFKSGATVDTASRTLYSGPGNEVMTLSGSFSHIFPPRQCLRPGGVSYEDCYDYLFSGARANYQEPRRPSTEHCSGVCHPRWVIFLLSLLTTWKHTKQENKRSWLALNTNYVCHQTCLV